MDRSTSSPLSDFERDVVTAVSHTNDQLGIRERVRGLDYFRCIEYPLVVEALRPKTELSLLDMGCGSGPFALYLSLRLGIRVVALDLDPTCTSWQKDKAERLGLGPERFSAIEGDSRALPQPGATFDVVLNLGSIEHIPDDGDSRAAAEMARVLKPGGRAVVTIPFGNEYTEITSGPHVPTFERRYDNRALEDRLIGPSTLKESSRIYFGEPGFAASSLWYGIPKLLKVPFRRLVPRLSRRYLSRLNSKESEMACGVCLVLDKDP